jgi:hypothetical protein
MSKSLPLVLFYEYRQEALYESTYFILYFQKEFEMLYNRSREIPRTVKYK